MKGDIKIIKGQDMVFITKVMENTKVILKMV